jgi:catechol 2,3-dioxygenase-like lactoylglutathione lyase family enzyme
MEMKATRPLLTILVAPMAVSFCVLAATGQSDEPLGAAPISHVGLAVPDVRVAAESYAKVLGLPVPEINESLALASPDGGAPASARAATYTLANFLIELEEPKTKWGPVFDVLKNDGAVGHHLSVGVASPFAPARDRLIAAGGKWAGGTASTSWSYIDFRDAFGLMLEPISMSIFDNLNKRVLNGPTSTTFGKHPVTSVGIVVKDIVTSSKRYADIFGLTPMTINRVPLGASSSVKTVRWKHKNGIAVELDEPGEGPSPYAATLRFRGRDALHRIGIDVGQDFDAIARILSDKGGKRLDGLSKDVAYFDFTPSLGIVLEIDRTTTGLQ